MKRTQKGRYVHTDFYGLVSVRLVWIIEREFTPPTVSEPVNTEKSTSGKVLAFVQKPIPSRQSRWIQECIVLQHSPLIAKHPAFLLSGDHLSTREIGKEHPERVIGHTKQRVLSIYRNQFPYKKHKDEAVPGFSID